ncbi:hypothetical protein C4D60_Mb08t03590 [Musa balbisiana]|uniref:Secreted protein n=1 Tax=Musa balbisiana TaxID=52838 RepID=A0A4S8K159_MUSBA|nr:hypothetical protein C4D60_Mb08t03590 [Musa balbisiana]
MVSERLLFAFSPILNFLSLTQCTAPCHRQNAPSSSTVCTGEEFLTRSSQTGDYQWIFLIEQCRKFHCLSCPRMLI